MKKNQQKMPRKADLQRARAAELRHYERMGHGVIPPDPAAAQMNALQERGARAVGASRSNVDISTRQDPGGVFPDAMVRGRADTEVDFKTDTAAKIGNRERVSRNVKSEGDVSAPLPPPRQFEPVWVSPGSSPSPMRRNPAPGSAPIQQQAPRQQVDPEGATYFMRQQQERRASSPYAERVPWEEDALRMRRALGQGGQRLADVSEHSEVMSSVDPEALVRGAGVGEFQAVQDSLQELRSARVAAQEASQLKSAHYPSKSGEWPPAPPARTSYPGAPEGVGKDGSGLGAGHAALAALVSAAIAGGAYAYHKKQKRKEAKKAAALAAAAAAASPSAPPSAPTDTDVAMPESETVAGVAGVQEGKQPEVGGDELQGGAINAPPREINEAQRVGITQLRKDWEGGTDEERANQGKGQDIGYFGPYDKPTMSGDTTFRFVGAYKGGKKNKTVSLWRSRFGVNGKKLKGKGRSTWMFDHEAGVWKRKHAAGYGKFTKPNGKYNAITDETLIQQLSQIPQSGGKVAQ